MPYNPNEFHGPPERFEPFEEDLKTFEDFSVGDVVVTKMGDGTNPGIINRIVAATEGLDVHPGTIGFLRVKHPGHVIVFAEIEEIRSGKIVTTRLEALEHANPMMTIAVAAEKKDTE